MHIMQTQFDAITITATMKQIDPQLKHTEMAMRALQDLVPTALNFAPMEVQETFNNAMLNIAVNRILALEGPTITATLLWRLSDRMADATQSELRKPVDLMALDG